MRSVILGLVMLTVFAGASFAQEPPRVQLAVENCKVNPGASPAMSQALQELVEHIALRFTHSQLLCHTT